MAPEALPEARADATQASDAAGRPAPRRRAGQRRRPGQASDAAPGRPPARGGPTIDDAFVPLVERSYIVGPPPVSVHGRSCERETGHPQGVALLYTTCPHALVYSRATPCGWPAATGSVRFWGHPLRVACGDRKCTLPGPPLAAALRRPSGNASGATPGGWPGSGLHLESLWMLPVRKRIMYGRRDRGQ